jgi:protein Hikeshi
LTLHATNPESHPDEALTDFCYSIVQTDLTPVSQTQFTLTIPASPPFNHLVIFLLPGVQLPAGSAAGVYIQLPSGPSSPVAPEFKLLGALTNAKQSAIYKVRGLGAHGNLGDGGGRSQPPVGDDVMLDDDTLQPVLDSAEAAASQGGDIIIGISLEPEEAIGSQLQSLSSASAAAQSSVTLSRPSQNPSVLQQQDASPQNPLQSPEIKILAQRIIKNAFNYLASFAAPRGEAQQADLAEVVVPIRRFEDWWGKFEKRVEHEGLGFLGRED